MGSTQLPEGRVRSGAGQPYAFADRKLEDNRLRRQAAHFAPATERAFLAAGLTAGSRVLDLGSGAGDVSMLAARLVGAGGQVVGIERASDAVASANARVRKRASPTSISSRETRNHWMGSMARLTP